jgi:transposase
MYVLTEQKEAARAALMQARAQQRPVIKVGIDAHLSQMMVVVQHDETSAKAPVKCEAVRVEVMARGWIQNGAVVFACYEAGPLGFGLQRRLAAAGVYCLVVRPRTLNEYGSRVKTDRRDAAWLCANLDRYLYGNDQAIAPVSIPSEAEERWRAGGRERRHLSRQRRREIQRFRGTCLSQGFNLEGDWWRPRRWTEYQQVLPIELREQGERMLGRLEQIDRDLKQIDEQLAAQLPAAPPHGVGALTSALVDREIVQWNRFRCRQQVASYFGLVPSEHSSGNDVLRGSITKQGNGALRHLLIEASWRLVRFQPGYCRVKKWSPVFTDPKAGCSRRKKAIVALARQFAVDLWRIRTGRVSPEALGLTTQNGCLALRDSAANRAN